MNKLVEEWKKGWKEGEESVLQFLKEMKGLDFEEEYQSWANADEYQTINGEIVQRKNPSLI